MLLLALVIPAEILLPDGNTCLIELDVVLGPFDVELISVESVLLVLLLEDRYQRGLLVDLVIPALLDGVNWEDHLVETRGEAVEGDVD